MWTDEMIPMLRYLVNDIDSATYTDARLQKQLSISARYVNQDIFGNTYTVDVSGSGSISPDPTTDRNESFINLTVLHAGCMMARNEFKLASNQAILIKDGPSTLDLKGRADSKKFVAEDLCKLYQDAKFNYAVEQGGVAGQAVFSTFNFGRYRSDGRTEFN